MLEKGRNVVFWLKADMPSPEIDVCFTPRSGHSEAHAGLPLLTHTGSRRFVLTNLKCKSEIRIAARDLLTFDGREVRSGEALSFPRIIG